VATRTPRKKATKGPARKATAKKSATPKKKAPKRASSRSPKARLGQVVERLDKAFGAIKLPDTEDVLEKAVYLILREGLSDTAVKKAMNSLREEFVDWNEVRTSPPSELARMMLATSRASSLRKVDVFVRRVVDMIDQVYNDRNDTPFDFLLDMKARDQIEYLEDLDDLGLHNAYALVQWLSGDNKLALVSSEMAKTAQKLGLTDTAAVTKVRKELSALVGTEADALVTAQAHLNQLGELDDDEWPSSLSEFVS
jgi:endonuclease III